MDIEAWECFYPVNYVNGLEIKCSRTSENGSIWCDTHGELLYEERVRRGMPRGIMSEKGESVETKG